MGDKSWYIQDEWMINLANTSIRGVNIAGLNESTNQQALLCITQPSYLMMGPRGFLLKCWAAWRFEVASDMEPTFWKKDRKKWWTRDLDTHQCMVFIKLSTACPSGTFFRLFDAPVFVERTSQCSWWRMCPHNNQLIQDWTATPWSENTTSLSGTLYRIKRYGGSWCRHLTVNMIPILQWASWQWMTFPGNMSLL